MIRFLAGRLGTAALVLFVLTLIVFVLARVIPADPAVVYAGPKAPPEELARIREKLGFDQPLVLQYFNYLTGLVRGDWGDSLATKRPVLDELATRLPATLELLFAAMLFAIVVGIVLGVVAARRPGKALDGAIRFLAIGGVSMPAFWLGLLLQVLFVGQLKLLPATGQFSTDVEYLSPITPVTGFPLLDSFLTGNWAAYSDGLAHLILPALTLAAYPLGLVARMTRASMLEVLSQDYVFTASAYGLRDGLIRWRLALKNALPPTMTIIGLAAAYTLTGTFFVEVVFNWPGIGQFAAGAMLAVDYPAIMAITLLGAAGYLIANFVVDLVQARLDPRVRLA
ncbi:peptide/nickel transport system permease protein [Microbacterium keratanolyticum]|uniref:Peptide ABC transporter permease n=1 Tax=Microbacterium keratanolyticum TaxID=67574 RepID=A0A9W6HRJ2_9MICO|nr:ABC transporter permease [Microbacterium keratanolyticum]MBM7468738.1 peptide/nickel transport system permease protein [Microbacterium keratanolyticum]GLK00814.1 peptide ABC transporter permease [Microbacterium keratanolyticum]